MKHVKFLLLFWSSSLLFPVFGQAYVWVNGGFGFSAASEKIEKEINLDDSRKVIFGSYGKGIAGDISVGYMMNDNWGFDLGVTYKKSIEYNGNEANYMYLDKVETIDIVNPPASGFRKTTSKGNYWGICPSVVLQTKIGLPVVYAKFGLLIAYPELRRETETIWGKDEYTYQEGVSTGVKVKAGVLLGEGPLQISAEITLTSLSYKPKVLHFVDSFGGRTGTYNLQNEFKSLDYNTDLRTQPSFPFSDLGINLGIKYNINLWK